LQYVDFSDELSSLVMPYMSYGNLDENPGVSSITVLLQILSTLEHVLPHIPAYCFSNTSAYRAENPSKRLTRRRQLF
jgi:hypothetical protein